MQHRRSEREGQHEKSQHAVRGQLNWFKKDVQVVARYYPEGVVPRDDLGKTGTVLRQHSRKGGDDQLRRPLAVTKSTNRPGRTYIVGGDHPGHCRDADKMN